MKTILLVGSRGMLGTDLGKLLSSKEDVTLVEVDLPELDITDREAVETFVEKSKPDVVVNCAAWTDVDGAESHADEAFAVNAEGAGNLAAAAETHGAKMVHVSTDFVFDGTKKGAYVEDDEPNPTSVYGESKFTGERMVI